MAEFKYYKTIPTSAHVWFKLLDSDGKCIQAFPDNACYSDIAHGFSAAATQIHIYHNRDIVPYNVSSVKRWITDINEMGFPCTFKEEEEGAIDKQREYIQQTLADDLDDTALMIFRQGVQPPPTQYNFFINLSDYEDKNHLFSTFSLIRCITETGICKVAEEYFKLMDENPERDKFEACQIAHKIVTRRNKPYDPNCYANTGHMVTYDGNGENISKTALMERFASKKIKLREKGYLRIHANWNGGNSNAWKTNDYYYGG